MQPELFDPYRLNATTRLAEDQAAARQRRLARRPRPPGRWREPTARLLHRAAARLAPEPTAARAPRA
jgi:hypothetical protein